jgi:malto-oligosyltrehalose trehalohydrolase
MKRRHAMPFGAEWLGDGRTRFRLWAPGAQRITLEIDGARNLAQCAMKREPDGWFECVAQAAPGTRYAYRLESGQRVPDPASRCNAEDVHGASVVVDPQAYSWQDDAWRGRPWHQAVLYELHVGTFSPQGTFEGVLRRLDHFTRLGVTAIELMPLAEFPGRRGWGYDGVLPYAPDASYGAPDDLKRLIDAAHARGLMVFVDVVYNHFGPEGNYLPLYAPQFFTARHHTPWGDAINYDGAAAACVREFFIHNALYWLEEYHVDGLRLDAVHAILDDSEPHVLQALAQRVRAGPGASRHVHLVLENDANRAAWLARASEADPRLYDGQWDDDFHHVLHVLLTGERDGYYADYATDTTRQLARCLAEGYAYQGEPSAHRHGKARGEPSAGLPPTAFVSFLQNHDQVGNRATGERLAALAPAPALRAAVCAWLLAPQIPLLFMGEEFGADTPFLFFCDFEPKLAHAVNEGRRREFAQFSAFGGHGEEVPPADAASTFERSRLDWDTATRGVHAAWLALYSTLLALRASRVSPLLAQARGHAGRATVHGEGALTVTWTLGHARLELRLNLSQTPMRGLATPRGGLLHCEPASAATSFAAGELPPCSAAYHLDTAGSP